MEISVKRFVFQIAFKLKSFLSISSSSIAVASKKRYLELTTEQRKNKPETNTTSMENQEKRIKQIPYGIMNFRNLRDDDFYFVDKTRFISKLESLGRYLFLIRPRRMGKSLWLSMMECYYDLAMKELFEQVFRDTWIGENPTEERSSWLVLRLDFSNVNPNPEKVEENFDKIGKHALYAFLRKYEQQLTEEIVATIKAESAFTDQLDILFNEVIGSGMKLYLFIDEYDNFSNTILSTSGTDAYHELTHGEGFFRHFFNILKGGAMKTGAGQVRLFITGVSPITMDDVTSGFNVGKNISLEPAFNEMLGFTEQEVIDFMRYYADANQFTLDITDSLKLMKEWYNGYHFSKNTKTNLFNTDMVLYFVDRAIMSQKVPDYLIDRNVRIDYGKLRHLITIDNRLNGNFNCLRTILEDGVVEAEVADGFPLQELTEPNNFYSLLYYFGLLTFTESEEGFTTLKIPNQSVQQLMFGYIRDALKDTNCFRVNPHKLSGLVREMGRKGEWEPLFDFLAEQIEEQTTIRDYLSEEKAAQSILGSYLNITDYYVCHSEAELNKGYVDFLLEPLWEKYPGMRYGCLVEIKYIKRSEYSEALLQEKIADAKQQIESYAQDPKLSKKITSDKTLKLILIFKGWELVHKEQFFLKS